MARRDDGEDWLALWEEAIGEDDDPLLAGSVALPAGDCVKVPDNTLYGVRKDGRGVPGDR